MTQLDALKEILAIRQTQRKRVKALFDDGSVPEPRLEEARIAELETVIRILDSCKPYTSDVEQYLADKGYRKEK